ncbi:MBL fold metallo-hydrolase [Halorarum salinum]|uniref:MBL fold metallo-hydrolase n=1 Tax=Halorarum salinum TaxID=2743089 RepID=A0A7D5QF06_9EURY|nr:MBL fold metallo-hydrolase [Halobaculum salinum]QLG60284.1 MBL fold metallo-hydrolase [Halobaculum salinum]
MPEEIVPEIYDITCRETNGRRYRAFLSVDGVPTLIDTGFEETMDQLFAGIDEIGVDPERLIITHEHADHVEGFDAVVDNYDVETWVPETIELDSTIDPDRRYGDGDSIGRFEAVHVPGHSPGNSALIDEQAGIGIIADVMFGSDLRGLPPGYLILPPEIYSNDLNEAERNLSKLLKYEFDVALVYHGSSVLENAKDKIEKYVEFPGKPDS